MLLACSQATLGNSYRANRRSATRLPSRVGYTATSARTGARVSVKTMAAVGDIKPIEGDSKVSRATVPVASRAVHV